MKRTLISFLAASLINFTGFSQNIDKANSAQDLTKIAADILARDSIPAMAFAVITKDNILVQNTLGHRKITELNEKPNASIKDYFH
jgi:hypothetical protein